MIPPLQHEIWYILLYCTLVWLTFSISFWLVDSQRRIKVAAVAGLLNLILVSVLSMLAGFAAEQLGTGMLMTSSFQIVGLLACTIAVSRLCQMLSWPRTFLVALIAAAAYILSGMIVLWLMLHMQH